MNVLFPDLAVQLKKKGMQEDPQARRSPCGNQIHNTKSVMKKAHSNERVGFEPVTSCIAILIICCCQNSEVDGCLNSKEYLSLKCESMSEYIFYVIVFND